MRPTVTKEGIFDCQVCVPKDWTDEQVLDFAASRDYTGGQIRKEGNRLLRGDPERQPCYEHENFVHIMVDL